MNGISALALAAIALLVMVPAALAAKPAPAPNPKAEPVRIDGYDGEAMEPFVSRDGRFLFFNTRNDPGSNTNIHFAELNDAGFTYKGILYGTISYDLDAVATMAADGRFCFVSPREQRRTRISVLCGAFDGKRVNGAAMQQALATEDQDRLVFDVELSPDGATMIFAEGRFSGAQTPNDADLYLATASPRGFERSPGGAALLANINTSSLEYAPALSADGLTLYFTRVTGLWPFGSPKIFRAARAAVDQPFAKPVGLKIPGFVEAPSLAPDGTLYFHKRVAGRYQIWRLSP